MTPIEELIWSVKYARKAQIKRLNEHLEEKDATIGSFLNEQSEWQLDSLIRDCLHKLPQIKEELKPKPNRFLFWKK